MTDLAVAETDEDLPEDEEGGTEKPARKSRKRLFIVAGGAVALLLAAGAGVWFFMLSGSPAPADAGAGANPDMAAAAAAAAAQTYVYDLPQMTVNLSSPDSDPQFLKLTVALELPNKEMADVISVRVARVIDAFQVYLRELRRSDLDGSAGIYRLKEELRRRVNLAIYPAQVDNILFKEILVQ